MDRRALLLHLLLPSSLARALSETDLGQWQQELGGSRWLLAPDFVWSSVADWLDWQTRIARAPLVCAVWQQLWSRRVPWKTLTLDGHNTLRDSMLARAAFCCPGAPRHLRALTLARDSALRPDPAVSSLTGLRVLLLEDAALRSQELSHVNQLAQLTRVEVLRCTIAGPGVELDLARLSRLEILALVQIHGKVGLRNAETGSLSCVVLDSELSADLNPPYFSKQNQVAQLCLGLLPTTERAATVAWDELAGPLRSLHLTTVDQLIRRERKRQPRPRQFLGIDCEAFRAARSLDDLVVLTITGVKLTLADTEALGRCLPQLQTLVVTRCAVRGVSAASGTGLLRNKPRLRILILSWWPVTEPEMVAFGRAASGSLERLHVRQDARQGGRLLPRHLDLLLLGASPRLQKCSVYCTVSPADLEAWSAVRDAYVRRGWFLGMDGKEERTDA